MASVLDTAVGIAKESTYGTFETPTRGYEAKSDNFALEQNVIESLGFYGGRHTIVSDRRVVLPKGASGTLEFDLLNKGLGLLLQGMLGTVAGPTQVGATTAYTTTIETAADDPGDSYTLQVHRVTSAGTTLGHTYLGGVVTGWTLSQDIDQFTSLSVDMAFSTANNTDADGTISYPTSATPFHWGQCVVAVNSTDTDVRSCSLTADLGMKTDRYFLTGSTSMSQPVRSTLPRFSGELETEYVSDTIYDLAVAGTAVPITMTWTGGLIEAGHNFSLTVTLQECVFDIVNPSAAVEDLPSVTMPFTVLWDESNPAVSIVYKSSDTAL